VEVERAEKEAPVPNNTAKRIQEKIMFAFLKSLVSSVSKSSSHRSATVSHKARLGVESLERREIPSVAPIAGATAQLGVAAQGQQGILTPVALPPSLHFGVVQNLQGITFAMTSLNNGTHHQLAIKTQTDHVITDSASFTGVFSGQNGGSSVATGTLVNAGVNRINIQFSWANGTHRFSGTITGTKPFLHIDGEVTVNGSTTQGPGHLVGQAEVVVHVNGPKL
jgi:hypothetical protein